MVYEGGLEIYTTLDPDLQEMASEAVDSIVNPEAGDPSAALVSIDPSTGAIRAMVGGSDFDQVKFNLATQAHRQAGSSFKSFSYAEAVHEGISPETMYISKHLSIDMGKNAKPYEVDNYDFIHRGPITLLEGAGRLGQHRLRPARPRPRASEGGGDGQQARRGQRDRRLPVDRDQAASGSGLRRWRWPRPTRPSPTGARTWSHTWSRR